MHAKRRKLEETKPQSHLDFAKIQLSLLQKRCGTEFAALGVRRKEIFDAEHEFRKLKEAVESSESELDELKAAVQTTLAELEEAEEKKQAADRALAAAKLLDSSSAAMIPATKTRIDAAQIRLAEVEVHKVSEETTINGLVGELARAKRQNVLHKQLAEKRARFGGS